MAEEIQRRLLEAQLEADEDGKGEALGRALRSPDFLARAMRSRSNAYLVRTM